MYLSKGREYYDKEEIFVKNIIKNLMILKRKYHIIKMQSKIKFQK